MDECNNCYGRQKVDWNKFTNAIVCVGIFIGVLSFFLCLISAIGNNLDVSFYFVRFVFFGMVLAIEGTIASFFKVGD